MSIATSSSTRSTLGLASSGTSPGRIHLVGLGAVARAFLRRCADLPADLVAATDSRRTVYSRAGIDPAELARTRGDELAALGRVDEIATQLAVELVESDVLVDACASHLRATSAARERVEAALSRGARVCLASKDALLERAFAWRSEILAGRVGWNAALGGTGVRLARELEELSANAVELVLVPNATTSAVIDRLERGATLDEGLEHARALGLCEHDAALDLDGTDAAAKLAIVAGALLGRRIELDEIARDDLRELDVELLRERARREHTTRLVASATRDGRLSVRYEAVPRFSIIAAPPDRVVYTYRSRFRPTRVHVGHGLGAEGAARALALDVFGTEGGAL